MTDPQTVKDWLTYLAGLNVGGLKQREVELRLAVMAPALARRFSAEAFTVEIAEEVAEAHWEFFPTFGELCHTMGPLVRAKRERDRLLALPPPRAESREPYRPGAAPDWCFEREPRLMGRVERGELKIQPPRYTVAQQIALLNGEPVPLKAAATDVAQEVKRGPVLVEDEPEC